MIRKQENLKSFNLFHYLKEQEQHNMAVPYFLANDTTYKNAGVSFPLRNFAYGIGITYTGKPGTVKIGSADYVLQPGSLTTIGPGIVSQWEPYHEAKHETLYFTENIFTHIIKSTFLDSLPFFQPGGHHVLQTTEEQTGQIKSIFALLTRFSHQPAIMPGLIYSLLKLAESFHQSAVALPHVSSRQELITADFRKLLTRHAFEQKEVGFYAAQLNITPKYLSEVLLEQTGKTAKKWIDDHLAMEAKSLLKQTAMTVQEISFWLGFEDISYFTKTFKKWEGMTPVAFRKL
ncbi:helix-turn-helix domain-containing protein [Terrimonas rubra]|uniref:Helix-turn-helix domain-containing protein n=1 Tax=Terrimonas rubra TaxID=1035890 RepID=A0ABW6AA98_9BACT